MNSELIGVESLQSFLVGAVPRFRMECHGSADNVYMLLSEFRDHIARLFREEPQSEQFRKALSAVSTLLERGTDSVTDATVISIIDVIIRDDALRTAASDLGPRTLSREIAKQVANWEEFRRNHPELIKPKEEW